VQVIQFIEKKKRSTKTSRQESCGRDFFTSLSMLTFAPISL